MPRCLLPDGVTAARLTLDQLVLVRIQVRQLLANPSSGVFLSLRVETVPDGSLTCRLLILPPTGPPGR